MAASFGVDLIFKTQGLQQIEAATRELRGVETAAGKIKGTDPFTGISQGARAAGQSLQGLNSNIREQGTANAKLASNLRKLKTEYAALTRQAQESARAGGAGFNDQTISRLRGLSTEMNRTRGALRDGQAALVQYRGELARLGGMNPARAIAGIGPAAIAAGGGVKVLGAALQSALGPLAAITGAVGFLTEALKTITQQDFAEAKVRTLGVNSADLRVELKKVSAELKGQASIVELTGAAYDVASAGFNNAADAAKVLKAASQGATGGFTDINTVGNAATSVLNAYGLSAENAGLLVDRFIQTQNDGKIVIGEYAQNIGKVAAAAAGLSIPLEEVNAVIAQSTASGVQAEIAFTGLKASLARFASGEAAKALKDVGLEINASTLATDGLLGTFKKLKAAGLDTGQIFQALGTEAAPALLPIINNLERYEELIENQKGSAGAAATAAATAANTIQGAWNAVQTAFKDFFSEQSGAGDLLKVTLQGLALAVKLLGETLTLVMKPFSELVKLLGQIDKALGFTEKMEEATKASQRFGEVASAGFRGLEEDLKKIGGELMNDLGGSFQPIADQWSKGMEWLGGEWAKFSQEAATAAGEMRDAIREHFAGIGQTWSDQTEWIRGAAASLWESISDGAAGIIAPIGNAFRKAFDDAWAHIQNFWNGLPGWLKAALQGAASVATGVVGVVNAAMNTEVGKRVAAATGKAISSARTAGEKRLAEAQQAYAAAGTAAAGPTALQYNPNTPPPGSGGAGGGDAAKQIKAQEEALKKAQQAAQKLNEEYANTIDKLRDARIEAEDKMAELRLGTIDKALAWEKEIGKQRLAVEREVADLRSRLDLDKQLMALNEMVIGDGGISDQVKADEARMLEARYEMDQKILNNNRSEDDRHKAFTEKLEDFKLEVSKASGKIQQEYSKKAGQIIQGFSVNSAKILEVGGNNAGARIEESAARAATMLSEAAASALNSGAFASVGGGGDLGGGRYIQGGWGPKGPNDYGAHFDIKRQDGEFFTRTALDQFVEVNGRPLSSGLTVPGGEFGARRDGGARIHNAWDYAFSEGASLGLKNGAKWVSNQRGSYGDATAFMTPDGQVYRIIHGEFRPAPSAPATSPAAAAVASSPVTAAARGGTLGAADLVKVASAAGFGDKSAIMAAIALAESSGRSTAHNRTWPDNSYGLWQINMLDRMGPERRRQWGLSSNEQLFDPATNARAAKSVYDSQGFNAWSVYSSGAYKQFLPAAQAAMAGGAGAGAAGGAPMAMGTTYQAHGKRMELPAAFNVASLGEVNASDYLGGVNRAQEALDQEMLSAKNLKNEQAVAEFLKVQQGLRKEITSQLNTQLGQSQRQLEDDQKRLELMRGGMTAELAEQFVQVDRIVEAERTRLTEQSVRLNKLLEEKDLREDLRKGLEEELKNVHDRLAAEGLITEQIKAQMAARAALKNNPATIMTERMDALKTELDGLTNVGNQVVAGADAISGAFSQAFTGIISGSMSARDAMAQMFESIGKHFLDMASQMIAKWMAMKMIGLVGGMFGGGFGGLGSVSPGLGFDAGGMAGGSGVPWSFSGGGYTGNGARAGGIDGHGGFPAILHPQETVVDHWSANRDLFNGMGTLAGESPYEENQQALDSQGRAFSDNQDALDSRERAFSENQKLITQNTMLNRERTLERERVAALAGGYEPIEVNVNAVDPASTGLVTVDQLAQSSQMAVKQAQTQLLAKLKNNPAVRAGAGL